MNPYILKTNNAVKKIAVILYKRYCYQVLIRQKLSKYEKPISDNECQKAIFQLANNKSPGLDGFSIEFYKTFWTEIKSLFKEFYDFSKLLSFPV